MVLHFKVCPGILDNVGYKSSSIARLSWVISHIETERGELLASLGVSLSTLLPYVVGFLSVLHSGLGYLALGLHPCATYHHDRDATITPKQHPWWISAFSFSMDCRHGRPFCRQCVIDSFPRAIPFSIKPTPLEKIKQNSFFDWTGTATVSVWSMWV